MVSAQRGSQRNVDEKAEKGVRLVKLRYNGEPLTAGILKDHASKAEKCRLLHLNSYSDFFGLYKEIAVFNLVHGTSLRPIHMLHADALINGGKKPAKGTLGCLPMLTDGLLAYPEPGHPFRYSIGMEDTTWGTEKVGVTLHIPPRFRKPGIGLLVPTLEFTDFVSYRNGMRSATGWELHITEDRFIEVKDFPQGKFGGVTLAHEDGSMAERGIRRIEGDYVGAMRLGLRNVLVETGRVESRCIMADVGNGLIHGGIVVEMGPGDAAKLDIEEDERIDAIADAAIKSCRSKDEFEVLKKQFGMLVKGSP